MGASRLGALFLLALAVPLVEGFGGFQLAQGSYAALAVLPWLALATGPRRRGAEPTGALALAALAVPPLALAAGLDRARGVPALELGFAVATSWLALLLWTLAAEHAARAPEARRLHAVLWFLFVPLGLALRLALAWIPARASGAGPGPAWLALDPLLFCHRWGRAGGLAEVRIAECAFVLCGAGLAMLAVRLPAALARQAGRR